MKFELVIKRKALKELARFPRSIQEKLEIKIDALVDDPLPDGVKKLEGEDDMYRIKQGDYRAVYQIDFKVHRVTVLAVFHRGVGY